MPEKTFIPGICIYCSDPRPEANLWKAIKQYLIPQGERLVPIGVLGGPICLANRDDLPKEFNFLMAQIHFVLTTFPDAKKIIVIGHDCGYYKQITRKEFTLEEKKTDLIKAANFIREQFPTLKIEAFFQDPGQVGFKLLS
jgi:hypothetical protein